MRERERSLAQFCKLSQKVYSNFVNVTQLYRKIKLKPVHLGSKLHCLSIFAYPVAVTDSSGEKLRGYLQNETVDSSSSHNRQNNNILFFASPKVWKIRCPGSNHQSSLEKTDFIRNLSN